MRFAGLIVALLVAVNGIGCQGGAAPSGGPKPAASGTGGTTGGSTGASTGGTTGGGTTTPPATPAGKLYAVDYRANAIHVFDAPAAKSGNVAPDRVIAGTATRLNAPLHADIDPFTDTLYVINRDASPDEIAIFPSASTANGNVAPKTLVIGGDATRLSVAIDWARDILYVGTNDNQVRVYANVSTLPSTSAIVQPTRTFTFPLATIAVVKITVDPANDRLLVPTALNNSLIIVDQASARAGGTPPYRELKGTATTFNDPLGLSVDPLRDEVYVANRNSNSLLVFGPLTTAAQSLAPLRTVAGAATGLATPIDVVYHREQDCVYQLNDSATAIRVFSPGATLAGDVAPVRTISGTATGFQFLNDLVLESTR